MLLAVIDAAGELRISVAIRDAPADTTAVFYLTSEAAKPLLLRHVRRTFPMSRSFTPDSQKPRLYLGSLNGAKETRTPDPLHAMQVLYQLSYGPKNANEV